VTPDTRCIVIGIGNPDRGDDGAGRAVAQVLRGALPEGVALAEADGEATALLAHLERVEAAFLVDACVSGTPAGTVRRIDAGTQPLPEGAFGLSTHGIGVAQAVELARVFGRLPRRCVVYAIEGVSFKPGAPLTPAVAAAVDAVARRVRDEISALYAIEETTHA